MEWHVFKEASVSDHRWIITYTLKCIDIKTKTYRNPRLTNWALHNEELEDRQGTSVQSIPIEYKSTENSEETLTIINDSLMSAYEKSCPLKKENLSKGTTW
ncbi:hypothetical protein Zmor_021813 [Zophobas morio]|uniref:Uncharacterized protein n=1 Tax=Zophobas morio TaxID=2755281 RepID=A0AA38MAT4_9CUCU|nr:hypothetical protein Zmor_021813 [Zophobas morio]